MEQTLLREGQPVPLTPKAFEILLMLLANPQRLLLKEEILRAVWPDTFVDEGNLTVQISTLRKTLGDSLIETVPRHGYRFLGTVTQVPRDGESALPRSGRRVWSTASAAAIVVAVVVLLVARRVNREPAPAASVKPIRSIAVLPFKPLAPSATDQYLGLGMADSLITRLSAMPHLVVRPTSAIRRYDRGDVDSVAAGRELQVDAVVEATVQRAENNVRVNARLLRVADGKSLWSEQFDAPAGGFFTVQDRVCENLATALVPTLTREQQALLKKRDTSNEQAYLAFVAGRYHFLQWTRNDWEKSVEHLNRAIALDPSYAAAYAALAHTYSVLGQQSSIDRSTGGMKVRTAALKALQLDPTLAEAHEALATSYLYEARWREAHQEMLRAMALNPNSVAAHLQYAELLSWTGQFDKSIAEARIARKIEPSSLFVNAEVGSRLYLARRYEEAAEDLRRVKALDPDFAPTLVRLGMVYTELGRHDEAIAELTRARAVEDSPERLGRVAGLGYAYGRAGQPAEARRILAELKERQKSRTIPAYNFALVHLGLGEIDETFRWLDRAAETRARAFLSIGVDPKFDAIRSDPRYDALVKRLDLPQPR